MITFGKLDENNIVLNVMVVDKKDTSDENGLIVESIGQAFCESITGWPAAQWVMDSEDKKKCGWCWHGMGSYKQNFLDTTTISFMD